MEMEVDNYLGIFAWISFWNIWFMAGILSVVLMMYSDFKKAEVGKTEHYWFKGKKWARWNGMMFSLVAPIALLCALLSIFEIMGCLMVAKEERPSLNHKSKYVKKNPKK